MKIALIEPFYSGSHKSWVDGFKKESQFDVSLFTLEGRHWKWRMHGAALSIAQKINDKDQYFDILLCTDFLDVATFKALLKPELFGKIVVYFHENQITYPWNNGDADVANNRDRHYGWINYTSAIVADACLFNSKFHKDQFILAIPDYLAGFPDDIIDRSTEITGKSDVLHVGVDYSGMHSQEDLRGGKALILWNHRWEYDKNPEAFFEALKIIKARGVYFELAILGHRSKRYPNCFDQAQIDLKDELIHWGAIRDRELYIQMLLRADILPVTSHQEFFGISLMEAMYCNTIPLLPNRLVYPEHFQQEWQRRQFFYSDQDQFIDKLQRFIQNVNILRKQSTRMLVKKYGWQKLIAKYDDQLKRISLEK